MKQNQSSDARSIGACLADPLFPVHRLLTEVERLAQLQIGVREWAPASLRPLLQVAALRHDALVIHTGSAAASTEIRYRQTELLEYLRQRFDLSVTTLVTRIVPIV